ncbi:winged helix-turn-helix domain-containing protein [Oceanobacillus manasiensis]|uniref:winged helix-turn-helix domain-containing protein n=1 Tax=Oceanobacillus manasiensis TaxID=586413 RepID=UPI0005A8A6EA|nr:crosslink repair DNA glycosylase YcaQ family protein [Oceanobacillus manasiensis]
MQPSYVTSKEALRRFLLETQHLSPESNEEMSVMQMIRDLECVQLDPVASVERNQHLVLMARIPNYQPEMLQQLLAEGELFEYWANAACAIPVEDFPVFKSTRGRFQKMVQPELDKLSPIVNQVLERFKLEGELPSRAFQSAERVHGAWDTIQPKTKVTSRALNLLLDAGIIRVVKREGSERFFHLTEESLPQSLLNQADKIEVEEAKRALLAKYIRAYRVVDPRDPRFGWQKLKAKERKEIMERMVTSGDAIRLTIEGIKTTYYIMAEDLDRLKRYESIPGKFSLEHDNVRFLPPLDNLLWRRERLVDLFDFTYKWEIYTPREKRQYGYYAMPILIGDQLVGRMDPGLDRSSNQLHIRQLRLEPTIKVTKQLCGNIFQGLERFAAAHHAKGITLDKEKCDI